jgi:hypothetical protein
MTEQEKFAALARIVASIRITNNGKLMIDRIDPRADRDLVPQLVREGYLTHDSFLARGDSVRVPGTLRKSPIEETWASRDRHCYSPALFDGPDYEAAIMARQEAAGYYD